MVIDYHQLYAKLHKWFNKVIKHMLLTTQENQCLSISNFSTNYNYIDMIIIFLLKEFLITTNLPFSEKQKTIIVLLASASVTCYQERKNLNAGTRMSVLSSFISSILLISREKKPYKSWPMQYSLDLYSIGRVSINAQGFFHADCSQT